MKKNLRLLSYLNMLNTNKYISAEEFSGLFNISIRTVFRDINTIEQLGIKIRFESKKGYYMNNDIPVQYISFTEQEKDALNEVYLNLKSCNCISFSKLEQYKNAIDKLHTFVEVS